MSSISTLIEVFKMDQISPARRASLIIKLGLAINDDFDADVTSGVVYELVSILDPSNKILEDKRYKDHL